MSDLLELPSVASNWSTWLVSIRAHLDRLDPLSVIDLGEHLSEVFLSTRGEGGREQASLAGGGAAWEALVCWYMNLCLIGSNSIVVKKASDTPSCVREALRVTHSNNATNSEADLVAVSFPDDQRIAALAVAGREELVAALDALAASKFESLRIAVVQCKTNWNDNAQIPMLWDMVYQAEGFIENRVTVGSTRYSLRSLASFRYAFVTVPTQASAPRAGSTAVARVMHLSGGNYWGRPTENQVAESLKEIFAKTRIGSNEGRGLRTALSQELKKFATNYEYFGL